MPELNGLKCWLEDGDTQEPFQEYGTKVEGNTITTFIETEPGKAFTVSMFQGDLCKSVALHFGPARVRPLAFSKERNVSSPYHRVVGICTSDEEVRIPFCFGVNRIDGMPDFKARL
jgi:hypothetical protein